MNLDDLNFKVKELVQFGAYAITATLLFANQNSSIDRLAERIIDQKKALEVMQTENKGTSKENQLMFQNIQNQTNLNTQQIQLLKQDVLRITEGYYQQRRP